jgi:hypothetical protein
VLDRAAAWLICAPGVLCRPVGGAATAWPGTRAPGPLPGGRTWTWSMTRHGCGVRWLGSTVRFNKLGLDLFPRIPPNGSELAKVPVEMGSQLTAGVESKTYQRRADMCYRVIGQGCAG